MAALVAVPLPVLLGFGIPLLVFGRYASRRLDQAGLADLAEAFLNSVLTAATAALLTVALALFLIYAVRLSRSRDDARDWCGWPRSAMRCPAASSGSACCLRWRGSTMRSTRSRAQWLGFSTGLLMTGSAAAVVLACTIRFLALAEGAVRSGMEKLPPNLDEAARSLGTHAAAQRDARCCCRC